MLIVFLIVLDYRCNNDATAMITNILYCELSVIQGIALNTGILPFSKGRVLQETSCILIAGLLERNIFDLYFPEFDKPWLIHLRETCCCSTNLCTWRPNTVYKNRSMRRHQGDAHNTGHLCSSDAQAPPAAPRRLLIPCHHLGPPMLVRLHHANFD